MNNSRGLVREVVGTLIIMAILAIVLVLGILTYLGLTVYVARAQTAELMSVTVTIPIDTVVEGDPGSSEVVATLTPADLDAEPGWICDLVGFGDNGESTHPDTNAIITSNGDQVVIPDWERAANTRTAATNGTLTLGATITIAIQVGEDRIASGGLEVQFTCNPPTTTTIGSAPTTQPTATTSTTTGVTTPSPTAPPATTTTLSEPPVGGVPAGGGACADGACNGSLSPLTTWLLIGVALLLISGLAWAAIAATHKAYTG